MAAAQSVATDEEANSYVVAQVEILKNGIISTMRGMGKTDQQISAVRRGLNEEIELARSRSVKLRNLRKTLISRLEMLNKRSTSQRDEKAPRRNVRDL